MTKKAVPSSAAPVSKPSLVATSKIKSLHEFLSQEDYDKAFTEALGRQLHDTYGVLWDIILSNVPKEQLLRRLMKRLENSKC